MADHHLACYQLNQVGNPSLDPYKYPIPVDIKEHILLVAIHF
jgi:hypothetical protein